MSISSLLHCSSEDATLQSGSTGFQLPVWITASVFWTNGDRKRTSNLRLTRLTFAARGPLAVPNVGPLPRRDHPTPPLVLGDTMPRAALVTLAHGPVEVRDVQMPELEPTAMLAEVEAATLCGTDVHFWEGQIRQEGMPYIPGHETAGRVVEIKGQRFDIFGEELKPGDRILMGLPLVRPLLLLRRRQPADALPQRRAIRPPAHRPVPLHPRRLCGVPLRTQCLRRDQDPRQRLFAAGCIGCLRPPHLHARLRATRPDLFPRDRRHPGLRSHRPLLSGRGAGQGREPHPRHRRARLTPRSREGVGRGRGPQHRRRHGHQAAHPVGAATARVAAAPTSSCSVASGAAIPEAMEMTRQGGRCLSIGVGGGSGATSRPAPSAPRPTSASAPALPATTTRR